MRGIAVAEIHISGLRELNQFLETLPAKMQANVVRGSLRKGMSVVQPVAKANVNSISGLLAAGLKISTRSRGGTVTASLKATGKHAYIAPWVEFGTKAHPIPKRDSIGTILAIGGRFFRSVEHPGARPKPFMRPALDSQASNAVIAAAQYMRQRLATKHGLDTSDIRIEGDE